MQLTHIELDRLCVSRANMRHGAKTPDIANLLPSVRARGVLVPLLVRPGEGDTFEIVAGRRRFHAALAVRGEGLGLPPLPCAVMEAGDDAAALEASLIENIARLDPDEVSQWETFTRLVKEGRSLENIAATFGICERDVRRVLALGNLLPGIRTLYRRDEIDAATIRPLTLASREKQREWLSLWRDPDARAPLGANVKHWLFGGQSILTSTAIFPLETYAGQIVADLFCDGSYFADAEAFWAGQMAAVEELRARYLQEGWQKVEVLETGTPFYRWQHEKVGKGEGGAVYIAVSARGEVEVHEGWLSRAEALRAAKGNAPPSDKPARPELTAPLRNYLDLHRHAAVRARLTDYPAAVLRLLVAHAICGSGLWTVRADPQRAHSEATAESVQTCRSETAFDEKRRKALSLINADSKATTVVRSVKSGSLAAVFDRLLELSEDEVHAVAAAVMGETLEVGSAVIDVVGVHLNLDMAPVWEADDAFFDLLRDRLVVSATLADVAGSTVAQGNAGAPLKVQKAIVRDCLAGENGREKVENWMPRWLRFPSESYALEGGA